MAVKACFITNIGARDCNEDGMLLDGAVISGVSMNGHECVEAHGASSLYIVADGMGGHARGEVASKAVLTEINNRRENIGSAEDLLTALLSARQTLNKMASEDMRLLGLGTTVAGIALRDRKGIIFNCGDSRVYRLNGAYLEKLSHDHSVVQSLADSGMIAEEEMRFHPQKSIISSAIMGDLREASHEVYIKEIDITGRQIFLLCTDGLWDRMDTGDMEACFSGGSPASATDCLMSKALQGVRGDNVSIIVLEVTASDSGQALVGGHNLSGRKNKDYIGAAIQKRGGGDL